MQYGSAFAWGNFYKIVFYGRADWASYSYWIVPGSVYNWECI